MANKYGEAALMAARHEVFGNVITPAERWREAVKKLYPRMPAGQKKAAPREAFLALCEAGLIKEISATASTATNRNRTYALRAANLLAAGTHKTVTQLWNAVTEGELVPHASQMDVVLALWKNGLLVGPRSPTGAL